MKWQLIFLSILGVAVWQGCQPTAPTTPSPTPTAATADGQAIFKKYCVNCHGANGKLGLSGAKDLTLSTLSHAERVSIITQGRKLMTPFGNTLSAAEIDAVATYTLQLAGD